MKGLDGVQGPVYVGTGTCFKRSAIYGYDPPPKDTKNKPGQSKGMCPDWLCGPRKKGVGKTKAGKGGKKKSQPPSRTDSTIPIFSLEDIEEGIEGRSHWPRHPRNIMFITVLMSEIMTYHN